MSQQPKPLPQGQEWAVGMPAYWLWRLDHEHGHTPEQLTRFYFVKPGRAAGSTAPYDQRLLVRVGGTEKAASAVVDFVFRYGLSMESLKSKGAIHTVQERMVRAWELAGRPGAA